MLMHRLLKLVTAISCKSKGICSLVFVVVYRNTDEIDMESEVHNLQETRKAPSYVVFSQSKRDLHMESKPRWSPLLLVARGLSWQSTTGR